MRRTVVSYLLEQQLVASLLPGVLHLAGTTHPERFLLADVDLTTDLDPTETHVFVSTHGVLGVMPMPAGRFRLNGTLAEDEQLDPGTLPNLMRPRLGPRPTRSG